MVLLKSTASGSRNAMQATRNRYGNVPVIYATSPPRFDDASTVVPTDSLLQGFKGGRTVGWELIISEPLVGTFFKAGRVTVAKS